MDGIVQNELFIGTELGIVSGFELSVLHMVIFHAMKVASLSVFE